MAVNINQLWEEKISNRAITDMVYKIARGDKDLYQEGLLGIRYGLSRNPRFTDDQLIREARWYMGKFKKRGVSLDNGPNGQYRKTMPDGTMKTYIRRSIPVYIDAVMDEFDLEFPDYSYPPDILAMDRICAERFYESLNRKETRFINACVKTMTNCFYNSRARRMLRMSENEYKRIKQSVHEKFIQAFGIDSEIVAL